MLYKQALEYANDVLSGVEITTDEVRVQCQTFIDDLKNQSKDDFNYYFDEKALGIIDNLLKLMYFATGLVVRNKCIHDNLANFQAFFLANIFGWRFKADPKKYRYRDVILFIPRKNAKTFLASLIMIILMLTEPNYSEFYSICLDRSLAGEVKKAISQIIQASPAIGKYFKIPKTLNGKIECTLTKSFYQARTAEANRNNGIMPSVYIADEVAAFKDNSNITAMRSGQLNVANPLTIKLTTAYAEDQSIFLDELDYLKRIYNGLDTNDRLFALLYYANKPNLWNDHGLMMSNPLRVEANYEEIRANRVSALSKPSEQTEYLTKHMNYFLPTNSGNEFIALDQLKKCMVIDDDVFWIDKEVYLGLDLAMTVDNVSVSMVTIHEGQIYSRSWAFIPSNKVEYKSKIERVNYQRFIDLGYCFGCGDEVVDYGYIESFILGIEERFKVKIAQVGYDRSNCLSTASKLEANGLVTVEVKQHSTVLHPATKLLQESVLNKCFKLDKKNTLYHINFQNAKVVEDTNKNKYVNKKKSRGKVDMVVSTIIAIHLLNLNTLNNSKNFVFQH